METLLFAVDKMLGRLATWLRLIGQDATYGSHLSGRTLIRHARQEGRIVLTRDSRLLGQHDAPRVLFIDSDDFRLQLLQVVHAFHLDPLANPFSRCTRCNEPVAAVPKGEAAGRVPPYTFATQDNFVQCSHCGKIYWPATHHRLVLNELQALGFRTEDQR